MNIGPIGSLGAAQQEAADRAREAMSDKKAEQAGGIGETEQDEGVGDRDADGRRIWEEQEKEEANKKEEEDSPPVEEEAKSKDPDGLSGKNLDLSG